MKGFVSTRRRLALISGFLLALIAVLNISTYLLYGRAKTQLDDGLGERLRAIAVTLAHALAISTDPDRIGEGTRPLLEIIKAENLLSNVVILTTEGRTVLDVNELSEPGELNPFIDLDIGAVTLARSGLPAYTSLYRSGDIYLKSAYAPIMTDGGAVVGIVGVEAGALYFDTLRELGSAIIAINVVGAVIVIVLVFVFYRQSTSLDKAQLAILRGENLATIGRMVAGIAHEIRNPLSIIKTSAERLQRKYDDDNEVLAYISEEVDELNRILTAYLNFARAEPSVLRPTEIEKLVRRSSRLVEAEYQRKRVRLIDRVGEKSTLVLADDRRIQQAMLNVLINALQAVDTEGEVTLSVVKGAKFAEVLVTDNGAGISQRDLKDVVKPFFTTKKQGSGLGMSIVSNIVEEHEGMLKIRSDPGRGTEVSISIPLATP